VVGARYDMNSVADVSISHASGTLKDAPERVGDRILTLPAVRGHDCVAVSPAYL
jgi:hypothetical protein